MERGPWGGSQEHPRSSHSPTHSLETRCSLSMQFPLTSSPAVKWASAFCTRRKLRHREGKDFAHCLEVGACALNHFPRWQPGQWPLLLLFLLGGREVPPVAM